MLTLLMCALLHSAEPATKEAAPKDAPAEQRQTAFGLGAQTEIVGPIGGVSGVLGAYDGLWFQVEANIGLAILEDGTSVEATDALSVAVRLFFPLHRATRADLSLGGGAALTFLTRPAAPREHAWAFGLGLRARIFVVPNVAITGTLGVAGVLREGASQFLVAARPLGAAGFIYYFQ